MKPLEKDFGVILEKAHDKVSRYLDLDSRVEGSS